MRPLFRFLTAGAALVLACAASSVFAPQAHADTAITAALATPSTHSLSATDVRWTVDFNATSGLASGDSITLLVDLGDGSVPVSGCSHYVVTNRTTGETDACPGVSSTTGPGTSLSVHLTSAVTAAPGDEVLVTIDGATNPTTTRYTRMNVSTTADGFSDNTVNNGFLTENGVENGWIALAAKASTTDAAFVFTSADGLTASEPTTLTAAPGTTFAAACGNYRYTDDTTGDSTTCPNVTVSNGGATALLDVPFAIGARDQVSVVALGVHFAAPPTKHAVVITTPADPKPVSIKPKVAPASIGLTNLQVSTDDQQGTEVTYAVHFPSNGLVSGTSTITLAAPTDVVFAGGGICGTYVVTDDSTGASGDCPAVTLTNGGATATLTSPINAARGDVMSVVVNGVDQHSLGKGKHVVQFSTSGSPKVSKQSFKLDQAPNLPTIHAPVMMPFRASTYAPGATDVTYTLTLTAVEALTKGFSTVDLLQDPDTTMSSDPAAYSLTDLTTGVTGTPTNVDMFHNEPMVTLPFSVHVGDLVSITATGVTNGGSHASIDAKFSSGGQGSGSVIFALR
jgi:hypothetical protein